jgi:hypothetical protein
MAHNDGAFIPPMRNRIYFAIHKETKTIRVFHVRHWARKSADTDELDDLMDDSAEQDG